MLETRQFIYVEIEASVWLEENRFYLYTVCV